MVQERASTVAEFALPALNETEPRPMPAPLPSGTRVVVAKAARVVAQALRERILTKEFEPGTNLPPVESLVEQYGVSRLTLREAVNILEADGLVRVRRGPGGGATVQAPDSLSITRSLESLLRFEGTTIEELLEVRLVVDPLAARLAAENATEEDLHRMDESLERQASPKVLNSADAWFAENLYFHWAIAAAAHNPVVRVLCESLQHVALADTLRVRPKAADRKMSVQDHLEIVAMLKARDPDGASAEVRRHIERNREIRRRYLARRRQ